MYRYLVDVQEKKKLRATRAETNQGAKATDYV
jgi:hypothetical protein